MLVFCYDFCYNIKANQSKNHSKMLCYYCLGLKLYGKTFKGIVDGRI